MTEKLKLPNEVVDSAWQDDIDFEPYTKEAKYVSPAEIKQTTAEQAKGRNIKIGRIALFSKNDKLTA